MPRRKGGDRRDEARLAVLGTKERPARGRLGGAKEGAAASVEGGKNSTRRAESNPNDPARGKTSGPRAAGRDAAVTPTAVVGHLRPPLSGQIEDGRDLLLRA